MYLTLIIFKAINLTGGETTNHRLFKNLFTEIGAEHGVLFFYSHVRFLSKGRVLDHVVKLRKAVLQFLQERLG